MNSVSSSDDSVNSNLSIDSIRSLIYEDDNIENSSKKILATILIIISSVFHALNSLMIKLSIQSIKKSTLLYYRGIMTSFFTY